MDSFQALADPTRRAIVAMLAGGELAVADIKAEFDISAPAVSQHLKALRSAGLVRVRAEAQRRIYELNPEGLGSISEWLSRAQAAPADQSDAVERLPLIALVQARHLGARIP